jgi:5-deoxy-glucuronate isomerase
VTSTAAELAFAATVEYDLPTGAGGPVVVHPDDVVVQPRGKPGWERDVHDVIAGTVPARHLLVGETFNAPGQWSSFPPHKHDGADGEPVLEEVYYYRFDRPDGFGFQGLYEAGGEERAVFLRHGTIVGIPRGYHPVCAAPGYRLYYLWVLVGEERQLAMHEDPAHRWLNAR